MNHERKPAEIDNSWMDTFGDMVSLLLCFFIMLASISKVDTVLFEKVQSGLTSEIGKQKSERPIENMRKELTDVVTAFQGGGDQADVGVDDRGVVLNLDSGAMFAQGSAELKPEMLPFLKEVVGTLGQPRFDSYRIEIQGHTDDTPIQSGQFATNFDLAAARALATMRAMVAQGLPPERILISSFGQYAPRVPNRRDDGSPLPVNQALNRRVAVHVYPK